MKLDFCILKKLDDADGYLVPADALAAAVSLSVPRHQRPTEKAFSAALAKLVRSGHVIEVDNPDIGKQYRLTDDGIARVKAAS